jgi:hypothetical protein
MTIMKGVELLDSKTMNSYVWDFGVNPTSPENPEVWKAAAESSLPADSATPCGIERRPR